MSLEQARALDAADPLRGMRDRFVLPKGTIYLDGNSLGAMPKATSPHLREVIERQWGEDLITSWNKHNWIDWPTRIAGKLAPIVGARPNELLIADFNLRLLVQAACGGGGRASRPQNDPDRAGQFSDRPICRPGIA